MKKYLLAGTMVFGLMGTQLAFADVLPEGQKVVPVCAQLTGISELPKITIYARETGPMLETPKVWKPVEGECVDVGYKFNSIDLYAVDSERAKTFTASYDPANDTAAYKASEGIDVDDLYLEDTSMLEYQHNEYIVPGVDNAKKDLVVLLAARTSNLLTEDILPAVPAGVEDHITTVAGPVFTDVGDDSPYHDALVYLKSEGVVSGYDDGSFKPNSTINRAEFTKIIVGATLTSNGLCMENYANADGSYKNIFSDVLSPVGTAEPVWYLDFVCQAKSKHLVDGYPDGSFKPEQLINFAEAAKIIDNGFGFGAGVDPKAPWYKTYVGILETQKAIPLTIHQFNQKITRGEMAEIVYRIKTENKSLPSGTYADLQ
jgi:hypothetical protein